MNILCKLVSLTLLFNNPHPTSDLRYLHLLNGTEEVPGHTPRPAGVYKNKSK